MTNNITVRCPICNNSKSIDIRQKKFKKDDASVLIIEDGVISNGKQYPELTVISFTGCGHAFIVTNKKLIPLSTENITELATYQKATGHNISASDEINILLSIGAVQGKLMAIKFYKSYYQKTLKESKDNIEKILSEYGIKTNEGCFIATVCYGDYNSKEVILLRKYRDEVLMNSLSGRAFIRFYYFFSPFLSKMLSKSENAKFLIRKYVLDALIKKIEK
jgi:ribosomal protein L7/L12